MRLYLIITFIISTTIFLLVVPFYSFQSEDYDALTKGIRGSNQTWFFGDSVVRHYSKCDTDHRSIADMLAASTDQPVIDMSRGGMSIGRMLDITEILTNIGVKPKAVYFQIALDGNVISEAKDPSGISRFYKSNFMPIINKIIKTSPENEFSIAKEVEYKGQYYGNYAEFSKNNFPIEKAHLSCPETIGYNKKFIAFMYQRNFTGKDLNAHDFLQFRNRIENLQKKGVNVIFWIAPFDYADIQDLHGKNGLEDAMTYKRKIIELMSQFNVIDTSLDVPAEYFADRWCACGHLNQLGRQRVVMRLKANLSKITGPQ